MYQRIWKTALAGLLAPLCIALPARAQNATPDGAGVGIPAPLPDAPVAIFAPDEDAPAVFTRQAARRTRGISVDLNAVRSLAKGRAVRLDLFDDARFTGVVEQMEVRSARSASYSGRLLEDPRGLFYLVAHDGVLAGVIELPGELVFEIATLEDGRQVVREVQPADLPGCGAGPEHAVVAPEGPDTTPMAAADEGGSGAAVPEVHVMVVYTPQAQTTAGGKAAVEARAQLSLDKSNAAYVNSGINLRLRLVHTARVEYTEPTPSETSFDTMLRALTSTSDRVMDEVHTLRTRYGADLVCLFVQDGRLCGLAWVMTNLSTGFSGNGFSVVNVGCAQGGYTVAHEFGHNQGSQHARGDGGATGRGLYPYSYGWRFYGNTPVSSGSTTKKQWRTIMAYSPGTSIPYFSNPAVYYDGQPTGSPEGAAEPSNNAKSINASATVVSYFKVAMPKMQANGWILSDETGPAPPGAVEPGEAVTISFQLKNLGPAAVRALTATLTPTDSLVPITTRVDAGPVEADGGIIDVPFQLMVNAPCGDTVTATLALSDGTRDLGTVSFSLFVGAMGAPALATYSSGGVSVPLLDAGTVEQVLDVPLYASVDDVKVDLRIDHPYVADLALTLVSPDGATVDLSSHNGGSGDNFGTGTTDCDGTFTVFSDAASTGITTGKAPYAAPHRPEQALGFLRGKPTRGAWTLRIYDRSASNSGTLYCWRLNISYRVPVCVGFTTQDAVRALEVASGLANSADVERLNVVKTGDSENRVDMLDAVAIVRSTAGLP